MNGLLFSIFLLAIPMFAVTLHYIIVKKKEGQKYDKLLVIFALVVFSSMILWGAIVIIMAIAGSIDPRMTKPPTPLVTLSVFIIILNIILLIKKLNWQGKSNNDILRFQHNTFLIFSILIIIWTVVSVIFESIIS